METSFWLDPVHLMGITASALGVVALTLGLTILLVLRLRGVGYDAAQRQGRRRWHVAFGLAAVGLGLAHTVGRFLQRGQVNLNPRGPALLGLAVLLLGLSGALRVLIPWRYGRALTVFAWLHRLAVVGSVVLLARHVHYQLTRFLQAGTRG
jgi:hypothetical protein